MNEIIPERVTIAIPINQISEDNTVGCITKGMSPYEGHLPIHSVPPVILWLQTPLLNAHLPSITQIVAFWILICQLC